MVAEPRAVTAKITLPIASTNLSWLLARSTYHLSVNGGSARAMAGECR